MKQSGQLIIGNKYQNLLITDDLPVLWIPDNPYIDKRLSGHADLSVFSTEKGRIFTAKHLSLLNSEVIDEDQGLEYPGDVQLNACVIDNKVLLNEKYISRKILEYLKQGEWTLIDVKQGYTKCSVLVVDANSLITSDKTIHLLALQHGLDSLLIQPGYIDLPGFDYGFIGGCGVNFKNTMYLTGTLDNHPDRRKIVPFIESRVETIKYLSDKDIFDIGGLIKI